MRHSLEQNYNFLQWFWIFSSNPQRSPLTPHVNGYPRYLRGLNDSQVFMAWKSFWFQIFIYFSFSFSDRDRLQYTLFDEATGLCLPEHQWRMSAIRGPRILLDLVCTHFFARFVLFHFSSSVYISATQASPVALCFVLSYAFYWENIKYIRVI